MLINEIKYRAWHKVKLKMFLVDYIDFKGNCRSVGLVDPKYDEASRSDDNRDLILLQFVKYKDIDGKEIYEGDLVQFAHSHLPVVIKDITDFMKAGIKYARVIGNIYENPELCKPLM